jgi:hypothetical protein
MSFVWHKVRLTERTSCIFLYIRPIFVQHSRNPVIIQSALMFRKIRKALLPALRKHIVHIGDIGFVSLFARFSSKIHGFQVPSEHHPKGICQGLVAVLLLVVCVRAFG